MLVLSVVVGLVVGLAAVLLKTLISLIQEGLHSALGDSLNGILYLVLPGVGMLLAMLFCRYVIKDDIGHGVTKALQAVSRHDSRIRPHNMWSSVAASSVTIGFGGSVGAEAPIVYTGAAIGSNFARYCGMSYRNMTVLLGCGAAAAVAGIFKAPLAGVLFVLEILLFNISMNSMMPLLLSTVSATVVSYVFLGTGTPFECTLTPFDLKNIPFYLILGLFCGACSIYFIRTTLWMEDKVGKMKNTFLKWFLCALGLGVLIFLFPPLYGEGYESLGGLLNGYEVSLEGQTPLAFLAGGKWSVPVFFLLILLLKVFSMTLTNAGGGVGGTFGPTLFVGAIAGFFVARTFNLALGGTSLSVPEQNFVLVGMAGLMAGVMQAPMTAIFLIAEISGGYELFLPLILTATVAFGTTRLVEKYSIYTKRIAQRGELLTHDSDQAALALLDPAELVSDKYPHLGIDQTLEDVLPVVADSAVAVFPVLSEDGRLAGMLEMDELRKHILKAREGKPVKLRTLMKAPAAEIHQGEDSASVMRKFDRTEAWRLPVIGPDGRYLGFISRSRILAAYRRELMRISSED